MRHHFAAVDAGAGPHVDDVIGGANGLGIMLDDDHRVTALAQLAQQANQPLVIFLVQAYARLVENIEHSRQARTDLGRQPHPLELAAR